MQAGGWGMLVTQAIWEICKAHDKSGIVPAHYWNADYIMRWTNFDCERGGKTGITKGMNSALASGLLERVEDGSIKIHDWQQYQIDPRIGIKKSDDNNNNGLKNAKPVSSSVTPTDTTTNQCDTEKSTRQDITGQDITDQLDLVPDAKDSDPGPPELTFDYEKEEWNRRPTEKELQRWKIAYPAIDVRQQVAQATDWLIDKKNTKRGRKKRFERFLVNWFRRKQDEADRRAY
jgi:hypothetical protein